jgi:subtilisin family serine protease
MQGGAMPGWRVALIDSCGSHPGAGPSAAFVVEAGLVVQREPATDPTGHGSRIAGLIAQGSAIELLLGQVFTGREPASAAAVAAAVDWAAEQGARLVHLSLGLTADRAVLRASMARAIAAGCVVVASAPARGPAVFPAAYPGVIRGTGDARCAPGELSCLEPWRFGACPNLAGGGAAVGGASIGAARVTRAILDEPPGDAAAVVAALTARCAYFGAERRTAIDDGPA